MRGLYARLQDRQSLENLRSHRRHVAVDLRVPTVFDVRLSIAQVAPDDISAAAAEISSNFFIRFSSPLATQRKPQHGAEVPEQIFAAFSRLHLLS
ncbi:hypothetical protein [Bradyrhizobium sp. RT10b]|uniref:hypothetical protein n=1 Tax=Bradyrhizobium sp. RT10b TaxID=3156331 RepID=UPI0033991A96